MPDGIDVQGYDGETTFATFINASGTGSYHIWLFDSARTQDSSVAGGCCDNYAGHSAVAFCHLDASDGCTKS